MERQAGAHLKEHYLKPGEMYLTLEPCLITTILGSCLSVTMRNKHTGMSAICHAVMPSIRDARNKDKARNDPFQYVDSALEWMLGQFEKNNVKPRDIEVKMFGGAALFPDKKPMKHDLSVGKRNVETAVKMLKKNRVSLTAWSVGGDKGRKLIFNTQTGEVFAKFIKKADASLIDFGGKK